MSGSDACAPAMYRVFVDGSRIIDRDSFHDVFAQAFGFPSYYGRNMDAWIDCITHLDTEDSSVRVTRGELVVLEISALDRLPAEIRSELLECSAFVNGRRIQIGDPPILVVSERL